MRKRPGRAGLVRAGLVRAGLVRAALPGSHQRSTPMRPVPTIQRCLRMSGERWAAEQPAEWAAGRPASVRQAAASRGEPSEPSVFDVGPFAAMPSRATRSAAKHSPGSPLPGWRRSVARCAERSAGCKPTKERTAKPAWHSRSRSRPGQPVVRRPHRKRRHWELLGKKQQRQPPPRRCVERTVSWLKNPCFVFGLVVLGVAHTSPSGRRHRALQKKQQPPKSGAAAAICWFSAIAGGRIDETPDEPRAVPWLRGSVALPFG